MKNIFLLLTIAVLALGSFCATFAASNDKPCPPAHPAHNALTAAVELLVSSFREPVFIGFVESAGVLKWLFK